MGGAARYLAKTYGCTVRGIDMTEPYLETAQLLNEVTGLTDKVFLERGDVTDIRFDDGTFDAAWTQHAAQSVPDKRALFAELHRVLKPGGRCVVHDLYKGPGDPIHFPSFCAPDESICFLVSDVELMQLIDEVGLEVDHWEDKTEAARAANSEIGSEQATHEGQEAGIEGLDLFLVAGEQTLVMAENSVKDFDVGSVGLFEAVLRKP
jgi:SAM-dependent methyltransferase